MSDKTICLIAGLGNPGDKYKKTRHNAGFMVIDAISNHFNIPINKKKFNNRYGLGTFEDNRIILAKPQSYMNLSGPPVLALAKFYKVSCDKILIIHDDIDIVFRKIKLKMKGGDGGHKGIRSLIVTFQNNNFVRLRFGIGRSEYNRSVNKHVLGFFSDEEEKHLENMLKISVDAVQTLLCFGKTACMNRFN
jgi:PTH1 family peptidyl-tRNA hydrolase